MKNLILEVVRFLVEHPDQLAVEEVNEGGTAVLRLRVAESDLGRVIGRQGRTAKSLRRVLAAAQRNHQPCVLDIVEPGEGA
jgi:predicted RNA-binding protein YlqC (UPF0109 family)